MELRRRISISLPQGFFFLILIALMGLSEQVSAASNLGNETDRLSLLQFKNQISDDPHEVLKSWNDSIHHCQWQGVTCGAKHQRVIAITLTGMNMFGSVSPHLGNLSFLNSIELGENKFYGEIPPQMGRLFRLRVLNLSTNTLTGKIPVNLSKCLDLGALDLTGNALEGKIPVELRSLNKPFVLKLGKNNLTGEVPSFLGNLTSLQQLSLSFNNLEGSLPQELGLLANLSYLALGANKLTGTLPTSIFNISLITAFSVTENFLSGELPVDLGLKWPNLFHLSVSRNQFTGIIPPSIINASSLQQLDLGINMFEGQVPNNIGDLQNLRWFGISLNRLGNNSAGDLSFVESLSNCSNLQEVYIGRNNFGGELPNSIANISLQLRVLFVERNKIFGKIPKGFGRFINMYTLIMGKNYFSGSIPSDFGEFQQLQALDLGQNQLSGKIPSNLCNLTSLFLLDLSANAFEGEITDCFGNLRNLRNLNLSQNKLNGIIPPLLFSMPFSPLVLDLSYNSFNGSIPLEIGKLADISVFNLSYNEFSGEIPGTLGDCSNLEYLHMQGNHFWGSIPPKLASLKGIQHLDLSKNNLTGQIPKELESLRVLKYLNLSFNELEGEIPIQGVFQNASLVTLEGNSKLCGGIPELQFPSCNTAHKKKKTKPLVIIITSVVLGLILIFIILSILFILCFKRRRRNESSDISPELNRVPRISYHELHRATAGFSQENLIGSGSFGSVYRGKLDQYADRIVAIKVLNLQKNGASKSFKAECKTLRNIRHRNIVAILTYCSSIDFRGQEFMAIVYKYMQNGSLDSWLHQETDNTSTKLNLVQRLKISVDVASALHYLHNHSGTVIVHCDLKPSNILLDNDFNAHVADFGLSRLLLRTLPNPSEQETSNSIAVKGSIGYAAPEYGIGGEASREGDVYSFGILLLEMLSGRRPTDDIFVDGLNIHTYVEKNLVENAKKIVDPSLLLSGEGIGDFEGCIVSLFRIGLKCSANSPNDRMDMNEVHRELQFIHYRCLSLAENRLRTVMVHQ